ncbi:MAG: hypothetical protein J6A88_09800 [Oscillospiraceae bacterium]|nr:hypothetical protein [Oscillospiraceae bacterium]MBO5324366.1 hypothetical protein [Oscillospiraceae bacterium]
MKKFISMALALVMVFGLTACTGAGTDETVAPTADAPASALEVLENIWALYADSEKFPVMGGNPEGGVMDAPANWDLTYAEGLTSFLQLTADDIANIDEAATMIHMMNSNTFTGAVVHLKEGVSAADFAATARDAIVNGQWLCGSPEKMIAADLGGNYLLIALGVNDAMGTFEAKLAEAYPGVNVLYSEAITG